ncbi:777_t:CDS:2 [Funneliformis geosporum]|uniref:15766_t:CDS:1 n=1 Tax=Funneliformis geosporum TaxID=1117311 RepID=A0A9W4WUX1_9GLOM|nr:777_t:CDS:2 [Funneliformis geosporum]CAI2165447.1 15766_t:CDS:2 [Funneliformis geosporum]
MPPLFSLFDDEKLQSYYPDYLQLKLVQIIHRHGERTPVKSRLPQFIPSVWNLCQTAKEFTSRILPFDNDDVEKIDYRKIVDINSHLARSLPLSPPGSCMFGQLTDIGRKSMSELGANLRFLYVDKLKFLDETLSNNKSLHLRSTNYSRTFESLQQLVVGGLYPSKHRDDSLILDIHTRDMYNETLHPNFKCARLMKLTNQFNEASKSLYKSELEYLTTQLKSMVNEVAIDSKPSCNGIFDTVISAKANGIPVPKEFTDEVIDKMDHVSTGQWFNGYHESSEMRRLAMGPFLIDLRDIILSKVNNKSETKDLKFAVFSGHDSSMVPLLTMFSAFDRRWPKFNTHITLELFESNEKSWIYKLFSSAHDNHYVRVRCNDRILELPECQKDDQHHPNDKSLCTLNAFLSLVDSYIPKNYIQECSDD